MKTIWSPLAIERVSEIAEYIAEDDINAAIEWLNEIFEKIEQLNEFPESGRIIPKLNKNDIRYLIFGNYRIVYRIGAEQISILTVRHMKQILPTDEIC